MRPDTRVVHITGMGRSGSTVLELLLGRLDGWVAAGELRRYWLGESTRGWICGCGKLVANCEFWARVRADLEVRGVAPESYPRYLEFQRTHLHLRPVQAARLLRDARKGSGAAPTVDSYQRAMASLYAAVAKEADAHVVVDSSKQPQDAYLATWNPGVDLFAVHLVRDPRAVAHSFGKAVPEPQPDLEYMPRSGPFGTGARWTVRHGFVELLVKRRTRDRFLRLRYEDMAADPDAAVRSVARLVGGPSHAASALDGDGLEPSVAHTFSGNPLRLRSGSIEVRPDEAWMRGMSRRDRTLASIAATPLMRRYGYHRHAR